MFTSRIPWWAAKLWRFLMAQIALVRPSHISLSKAGIPKRMSLLVTNSVAQCQWNVTESHLKTYPMHMPVDIDVDTCVIPHLTHSIFHLLPLVTSLLYGFYSLLSVYGEIELFASYCTLKIKVKKINMAQQKSHINLHLFIQMSKKEKTIWKCNQCHLIA